ncbi:MAG: glycosyltransferase family 4 protein, partial [Victivallales bacterium]
YRPGHVEMYVYGAQSSYVYFGYYLALMLTFTQFVVVCRGGELYYWRKRAVAADIAVWAGLMLSNAIVYKQLHMPSQLDQLRVSKRKRFFFFNRVPVTDERTVSDNGVLFLNSWRDFRRPDIVFEAAMQLAPRFPEVKFTIAGARSDNETLDPEGKITKRHCEGMIKEAGLNNIRLLGWVDNPGALIAEHAVFALPTTLLFLNYTLLEAMELGLVPIVAHADGAERIIEDGVDGFIVDINTAAFADAIENLLLDRGMRTRMGTAAKEKIRRSFDLDAGFNELRSFYSTRLKWLRDCSPACPFDKDVGAS